MSKNFHILRGITMASALNGKEKQELLKFINEVERNVGHDSHKGLDRKS